MTVLGALMVYCFWLVMTTGAFWLVRMDEVNELFQGCTGRGNTRSSVSRVAALRAHLRHPARVRRHRAG